MEKKEPYYKLKLWEKIIEWQLLFLTIFAIMALIAMKIGEDYYMWKDILINIGCSVVTSVSLSILIYFKYLKKYLMKTKRKLSNYLIKD